LVELANMSTVFLQVNKKYININNSSRDSHVWCFSGDWHYSFKSNVRLQRVMETNNRKCWLDKAKLGCSIDLFSSQT